jgi:hypothetical protein
VVYAIKGVRNMRIERAAWEENNVKDEIVEKNERKTLNARRSLKRKAFWLRNSNS